MTDLISQVEDTLFEEYSKIFKKIFKKIETLKNIKK
jgi:hypothetical protein